MYEFHLSDGLEGGMWDLIVLIPPDHCLSMYSSLHANLDRSIYIKWVLSNAWSAVTKLLAKLSEKLRMEFGVKKDHCAWYFMLDDISPSVYCLRTKFTMAIV